MIHPLYYAPDIIDISSRVLVGGILLDADQRAIDCAVKKLRVSDEDAARVDKDIVNATLSEVEQGRDAGELQQLWERSIRHFSLTIAVGEPQALGASGVAEAREALLEFVEGSERVAP